MPYRFHDEIKGLTASWNGKFLRRFYDFLWENRVKHNRYGFYIATVVEICGFFLKRKNCIALNKGGVYFRALFFRKRLNRAITITLWPQPSKPGGLREKRPSKNFFRPFVQSRRSVLLETAAQSRELRHRRENYRRAFSIFPSRNRPWLEIAAKTNRPRRTGTQPERNRNRADTLDCIDYAPRRTGVYSNAHPGWAVDPYLINQNVPVHALN